MKVCVYEHAPHAIPILEAFCAGLKVSGVSYFKRSNRKTPVPCDLAVGWGVRNEQAIHYQRVNSKRYLVLERGYVDDRFAWTSVGYDGLNGYADFCNKDVDGDRWNKLFAHHLKPWKSGGEYVLLIGQVPGDTSLRKVNIYQWYVNAAREALRAYDLPVYFRSHPRAINPIGVPGVPPAPGKELEQALEKAAVVLTWNSNSGVVAALNGVPVVAMDRGSMAWDVSGHKIGDVVKPDRTDWCARLAWCQWSMDELKDGSCWDHVKKGLERVGERN